MTDTKTFWNVYGNKTIPIAPYAVMGIVNYTTNSFMPHTQNTTIDSAMNIIAKHIAEGVDILDIGTESTKPQALPLSETEELEKLQELLQSIQEKTEYAHIPISVDTYKASVASAVLERRCDIINDISGMQLDAKLLDVICHYKPGYVLTYNARYSEDSTNISSIQKYFEEKLTLLTQNGLPIENIVLDIGIGFGYGYQELCSILQNIEQLQVFGRPLFLGISYKTWYQRNKDIPLEQKERANYISTALLALKGFTLHRVHDVAKAKEALNIVSTLA